MFWVAAILAGLMLLDVGAAYAQRIFSGFYGTMAPRFPTEHTFQGGFNFCRVMFRSNRREKRGWDTDYPGAEINFSVRLAELTKTRVTQQPDKQLAEYVVVRLTDPWLFQCPFVLMEDAGTAVFNEAEVTAFREYLLKGGYAFVSDYWGTYGQRQFDDQIGKVLPRDKYPIEELPMDHPIWHMQFSLKEIPQMPSIQSWRRTGGADTERGVAEGTQSARGIADEKGRLMVVMIHNSDIPDGWEREGEDDEYFLRFSPNAYAVGINVVLYALTH